MDIQCKSCGWVNNIPDLIYEKCHCEKCGAYLPLSQSAGENSQAVGFIGGAALGAAIAGPAGAVIGGIVGAILGKEGKGLG